MTLKVGLVAAIVAASVSFAPQCPLADMLTIRRIPAALALEAVEEAVAACARQGYAETAVVVDADGVRQAVLRGDRAGRHTLDSAFEKAYTSASFKTDTSALVERAKTNPLLATLLAKLPDTLMLGGGLVIKVDDEVVAAIGTGGAPGGDLDDDCARAGLDKIRDRLK
jgi:uncharacterized protein GlcG (DUF336 family)